MDIKCIWNCLFVNTFQHIGIFPLENLTVKGLNPTLSANKHIYSTIRKVFKTAGNN